MFRFPAVVVTSEQRKLSRKNRKIDDPNSRKNARGIGGVRSLSTQSLTLERRS